MTQVETVASYATTIIGFLIIVNEWTRGFETSKKRLILSVIMWHLIAISSFIESSYIFSALFVLCSALSVRKYQRYKQQNETRKQI